MKAFTLLLAVLAVLCGCAALDTTVTGGEDWRGTDTGGVCPVHHVAMRTEIVPEPDPNFCDLPHPEYAKARRTLFPYAGIYYSPDWNRPRRGKIYVCPSCVLARKEWKLRPIQAR